MFSHEKLQVYHRATEWFAVSAQLIATIPRGEADLVNQLRRAALSIPLNLAEGTGKTKGPDKKRFYGIARGSTLECAAILDAIEILQLGQTAAIRDGKKLLEDIAAMLTALILRWQH